MDITIIPDKNKNTISSYGVEGFKVKETNYKKTLLLNANWLDEIDIYSLKELENVGLSELGSVINQQTEILLIGSGSKHLPLSSDFRQQVKKLYPFLSINEMTSAAACRTYNILVAEERIASAILLPIT